MGRAGLYIGGYALFAAALLLAAWKLRILASIGSFWTGVAVLVLIGVGVMLAASRPGGRIAIDR